MPLNNQRASWASRDDTTAFNLIVIAIGVAVFGFLGWRSYHGEISAAIMGLRHQEVGLLARFTESLRPLDAQVLRANPSLVTVPDLYQLSRAVGAAWRLPACVLMLVLGIVCARWAAPSRYRRAFDLEGLAQEQSKSFRSPLAYSGLQLRLMPPAKGAPRPADFALTSAEWIERFAVDSGEAFDPDAARRALIRQLGPRWRGPDDAPAVVQVVCTAFALHLSGDRGDAARLLDAVSAALATDQSNAGEGPAAPLEIPPGNVAQARQILVDPAKAGPAREIMARHAYTTPALMSLLNAARTRHGVLAPAQFAWLKLVDRPLWYALHSLGFETEGVGRYLHPNPRVEAAGARDHWAAERALGEPLLEPSVGHALAVLEQHAARRSRRSDTGSVRNGRSQGSSQTSG